MKMMTIGTALFAFTLLVTSGISAQMMGGMMKDRPVGMGKMAQAQLRMMMKENDAMMEMMHRMMDRFTEMEQDGQGRREMEEMMQKMGQMMMDHRMNMMMEENANMMRLMHQVMRHVKGMEPDDEKKREMEEMMQRMEQMRERHQSMMTEQGMMRKSGPK